MKSKYILIALITLSFIIGCTTLQPDITPTSTTLNTNYTPQPTERSEDQKNPILYNFTNPDSGIRSEKGMVYNHTRGDIRVFQVIKEKSDEGENEITWVLANGESLCIGVINDRDYVNGENLLKGKYRYIGPITYETAPIIDGVKKKGINTVRLFIEVDSVFDKAYITPWGHSPFPLGTLPMRPHPHRR